MYVLNRWPISQHRKTYIASILKQYNLLLGLFWNVYNNEISNISEPIWARKELIPILSVVGFGVLGAIVLLKSELCNVIVRLPNDFWDYPWRWCNSANDQCCSFATRPSNYNVFSFFRTIHYQSTSWFTAYTFGNFFY